MAEEGLHTVCDSSCPVCELCGTFENLLVCGGCKDTYYCSKEHQKSHWKSHKQFCSGKKISSSSSEIFRSHIVTPEKHNNGSKDKNVSLFHEEPLEKANQYRDTPMEPRPNVPQLDSSEYRHTQPVRSAESCNTSSLRAVQIDAQPKNIHFSADRQLPDGSFFVGGDYFKSESSLCRSAPEKPKETKLADYVVKCLNDYGICVVDHFMGQRKGDDIYKEVLKLKEIGIFQDGQLVCKTGSPKKIRGDKITWVEKDDQGVDHISNLIHRLDSLMVTCSGRLGNYVINGRTKAMVACYPGDGTGYVRHVDNPNRDGRCVTCIYYMNKDWKVQNDGGLLRIFPMMFNQVADIEPSFDRLLFFWSDRRNPHEVQPAFKTRYAITVWYFDAEERTKAKENYQTPCITGVI